MAIFTTILQVLLSLWLIIGGAYMMSNYAGLASTWALTTLPSIFWIMLALLQILAALVSLAATKIDSVRKYAPLSATILAIISLAGVVLYSAYAGFPGMLWALIPAGLLAFVAYRKKMETTHI